MSVAHQIEFTKTAAPIDEAITKFGGAPVWIGPAQWPLDLETEEQMIFLGQFDLANLDPSWAGRIAYVFVAETEPLYDDAVAVVVQESGATILGCGARFSYIAEATGPQLSALTEEGALKPVELNAKLTRVDEPEVEPEDRFQKEDLDLRDGYHFAQAILAGNKIGGEPLYLGPKSDIPAPFTSKDWVCLLQLAPHEGYFDDNLRPNFLPFYADLGEFGLLTVFLARDLCEARAFVQQP